MENQETKTATPETQEVSAERATYLNVFAMRVSRPAQRVTLRDGTTRFSILGNVYGQAVDPADPKKLGIYEKSVLVSFLVGENSELLAKVAKGTTLYIPAAQINEEPAKNSQGEPLTTKDGTAIHNFRGVVIGQIMCAEVPKAWTPTIKAVQDSKLLGAEAVDAEHQSLGDQAKGMLTRFN